MYGDDEVGQEPKVPQASGVAVRLDGAVAQGCGGCRQRGKCGREAPAVAQPRPGATGMICGLGTVASELEALLPTPWRSSWEKTFGSCTHSRKPQHLMRSDQPVCRC